MASIMNNNYKIKETHNVSEASSFEDRNIKSSLKESALRNNKTMNNKYRITIKDTPVQNTSKTHVETPHMRRSTCLSEINSGLKESALRINKTMNKKYRITIKDTLDSPTRRNPAHAQVDMSAKD